MKTFRLLGAALFAVLAFGVVAVASASAVEFLPAEWLVKGEKVLTLLPTESSGSLELLDLNTSLGVASILCTGNLMGNVGLGGEGEITVLLNTKGEEVSKTPLTLLALESPDCVNVLNCPTPLVWVENLPWNTLAELMVDGTEQFYVDLLLKGTGVEGNPAWDIECMGFIPLSDLCELTPESISELLNLAEDVGVVFSEAFDLLAGIKLSTCSLGGIESGHVESDEEGVALTSEGVLQVFSGP